MPDVYAEVYESLCRHRRFESFVMTEQLDTAAFTVYDFAAVRTHLTVLQPTEAEVADYLDRATRAFAAPDSVAHKSWLDV